MIQVLVVAAVTPGRPAVFSESVQQLVDAGASVSLYGGFEKGEAEAALPVPYSVLRATPKSYRGRAGTAGQKLWWRAMGDAALRRAAARADVLVALDAAAVHTVWQLSLRHRGIDAVLGLTPAVRCVKDRVAMGSRLTMHRLLGRGPTAGMVVEAARSRTRRAVRGVANRATGRRVQQSSFGRKAWQRALNLGPLPERVRVPLAEKVYHGMVRAGLVEEAGQSLVTVTGKLPLRRRAKVLAAAAEREFAAGRTPTFLREAAAAEMAVADDELARGRIPAAATAMHRGWKLLFHRVAHFDSLSTPSTADPARFYAPWDDSVTGKALAAAKGRSAPPAPLPVDRPVRLLLLYRINDNFLHAIRDRYADHPGVEMRSLDMNDDPNLKIATQRLQKYTEYKLGGAPEVFDPVEESLRPLLDWADVVFTDWFNSAAGMLTLVDPGTTRIMVRLHSFEAWTPWPRITDMSRIDDLVFVSEHLRDHMVSAYPRLSRPDAPRPVVLPNAMDLRGYDRPKPDSARFNLALVGISAIAKDPRWAIEVLNLLRAEDENYRLLLIGNDVRGDLSAAARAYRRAYNADLKELLPDGIVRKLGHTDDVPGTLTEAGVILSSSVRESFHVGLLEGAASHAVPVVRDWPFFPGAANQLFPAEWVVETPAQAAARIRKVTASDEVWRKAGAEAAAHVMGTFDWTVTAAAYDRLFGIGAGSKER